MILGWDSFLGQEEAGVSLQELLASDHHHLLDRSFTVRFRCLLDNTSGFLVSLFVCLYGCFPGGRNVDIQQLGILPQSQEHNKCSYYLRPGQS